MGKVIGFVLAFMLMSASAWGASFNLTWTDNNTHEDGTTIERKLGDTGVFAKVGSVGVDVTTFLNATPDNQKYCYRLRAFNVDTVSLYSDTVCASPGLVAPSGVTITITITITPNP